MSAHKVSSNNHFIGKAPKSSFVSKVVTVSKLRNKNDGEVR